MDVDFKIAANEIEYVTELSYYNHLYWKFKHSVSDITHFIEIYDDVSSIPEYAFGKIVDETFVNLANGTGDPIDENKIGIGGVWFTVHMYYPRSFIKF